MRKKDGDSFIETVPLQLSSSSSHGDFQRGIHSEVNVSSIDWAWIQHWRKRTEKVHLLAGSIITTQVGRTARDLPLKEYE